jgi:hypothetical protein
MGEVASFEALERDLVQHASSRAIQEFSFCGDDTQIAIFKSKRRFLIVAPMDIRRSSSVAPSHALGSHMRQLALRSGEKGNQHFLP